MSKKDDALKLALQALEYISSHYMSLPKIGCMALAAVEEALAEQPAQQWNAGVPSLYPEPEQGVSIKVEYEQPEFFTHNVEHPYDWSEWVCPDPKSYLMKCCDCGLVHEAQFGVVRYKSETEREDCEPVDDPNLQAVFRMRRSEQWSPKDTAHRAGGLPMEQPAPPPECKTDAEKTAFAFGWWKALEENRKQRAPMAEPHKQQEPVATASAWFALVMCAAAELEDASNCLRDEDAKRVAISGAKYFRDAANALYTSPQPSKTWVGLTDQDVTWLCNTAKSHEQTWGMFARAIEAKLREKNA